MFLFTLELRQLQEDKPATNCAIYGYKKDPNDKYHWLVDEEAAAVVQHIYQLAVEGHGLSNIANILRNDKVESPAAYLARQGRGPWKSKENIDRPYAWSDYIVGQILSVNEATAKSLIRLTFMIAPPIRLASRRGRI